MPASVEVPLEVLGVRVDIRLPDGIDAAVADEVERAWAHARATSGRPATHTVTWRGPDTPTGMHLLSQEVTRAALDARAGDGLMLHAAALASDSSGAVLVAVGASGDGKTTWVQAHGPGRRYLSDEAVLIADDGRVAGVAKPLSLGARGTLKHQVPPHEVGMLRARGDERLAGLWILDRDGTSPARLEPVDLLDALPLLAAQASYFAELDQPLHRTAALLESCGGLHRASYAEAADLADLVEAALP